MAKVSYVACASCHKEYYIDRILSDVLETNPNQILKCPFCKQEFRLGTKIGAEKEHDSKF
jgi:NAD-dependent SIR2 family protein deacetylase